MAGRPSKTPSDTPLPPGPDPHEYAVRLARNNKLIREFVDPSSISPVLAQNKVISAREADMVLHLNGKNKKWDVSQGNDILTGDSLLQGNINACSFGFSKRGEKKDKRPPLSVNVRKVSRVF